MGGARVTGGLDGNHALVVCGLLTVTKKNKKKTGADPEVMRDSDIVVVSAGAKQKVGQTRLELAGVNVKIMQSVIPTVLKVAPNAIIIMVANPCDVLATAALKLSGLPAERIFSSGTVLDSGRLRWLLSEKLSVHPVKPTFLFLHHHLRL